MKIQRSDIEGVGVFASEIIKNNTVIEFKMEIKENYDNEKYLFPWFSNEAYNNIASYLNHSMKPNLKIINRDRKKKILTFKVIRKIKNGEELTFNYQTDESKQW